LHKDLKQAYFGLSWRATATTEISKDRVDLLSRNSIAMKWLQVQQLVEGVVPQAFLRPRRSPPPPSVTH